MNTPTVNQIVIKDGQLQFSCLMNPTERQAALLRVIQSTMFSQAKRSSIILLIEWVRKSSSDGLLPITQVTGEDARAHGGDIVREGRLVGSYELFQTLVDERPDREMILFLY